MTPRRVAELVTRWVRFYTRDLPPAVARRRRDEIDADLHDHIAHERARGSADRRIALGIATRMVRGVAADASWRSSQKEVTKMSRPTSRSALRIAVVTALVLLVPAVWMQFSDDADWGVFDFVFAGLLVAGSGVLLELAARKPRAVAYRAAAVAVGVAAIVLGEADAAPGLVLFGCLLIGGTVAMAFRTALGRGR